MLTIQEESALEKYMTNMVEYGHPLSIEELRLKVALLTQERPTSFSDGILGRGWLCWFKIRHLDLTLRQAQGLEIAQAKGLCAKNVASFYKNLQKLYDKHQYPPHCIRNYNKSGAQA